MGEQALVSLKSFNAKLSDTLFNRDVFTTLAEARILIEGLRKEVNKE